MQKLDRIVRLIAKAGAIFAGLCVVAMMFLVTFDVLGRQLFASPIKGAYAITQNILMPCSFFTALPMCYLAGILPKVEGPLKRASGKIRNVNTIIVMLFELIMFGLMFFGGFNYTRIGFMDKLGVDMDGTVVRIYPMYLIIPIGFGITFLAVILVNLYKGNQVTDNEVSNKDEASL
ncbi:MAG: TRAP transporter small permease [Lachnospiraceae bacterium]|nr:TRAP transporter small permease [Lachnospiraceae bacterium]